jgi:hypothetical protein
METVVVLADHLDASHDEFPAPQGSLVPCETTYFVLILNIGISHACDNLGLQLSVYFRL